MKTLAKLPECAIYGKKPEKIAFMRMYVYKATTHYCRRTLYMPLPLMRIKGLGIRDKITTPVVEC